MARSDQQKWSTVPEPETRFAWLEWEDLGNSFLNGSLKLHEKENLIKY